jgi:hypothetical protein
MGIVVYHRRKSESVVQHNYKETINKRLSRLKAKDLEIERLL